jgi:methyl-accepting chemotaxis protein
VNFFARLSFRSKLRLIVGLLMGSSAIAAFTQTAHLDQTETISLWTVAVLGGSIALIALELTSRKISASVVQLSKRVQAIAEGDLTSEPVPVNTHDEIASLAQSIDRMQESLRDMIGSMIEISAGLQGETTEVTLAGSTAADRTQEMSAQTHQAASAMQEMSISVAEVSSNAQTAADSARQATTIAREGGAIVEEMLAGMSTISESVTQTADTVQRLGHESEQIIRIVNVIEEIAQKTNLLALNAAIEAARAGEQGRGFAVVAGEVRRLAESTRNATSEIAQMIESITGHTREAVEAMTSGTERVSHGMEITARAGESLKRIITAADQVESMIAQIATASTEQSITAQEFSQNLEVINRLSEEHNAASPVTKGLIGSIKSAADSLHQSMGHFRITPRHSAHRPATPRTNLRGQHPATTFGD